MADTSSRRLKRDTMGKTLKIISKSDNDKLVIHPHLSFFSCVTLKAAGHDEWGLSVVAAVALGCHHWDILASLAPKTAQGHWWAYKRQLREPGSTEALTASRSLTTQDSGRHLSHQDRQHGAQLSSLLDQAGVVQNKFHSEGMTTPQRRSLSAENQLFQRPHGGTTFHSSLGTLFHPSKVSI